MEDLIDRLANFITDLPVGLIIFILAIAFSFFGGDKKKGTGNPDRVPRQNEAPRPAMPSDDPFGSRKQESRPDVFSRRKEAPRSGGYTFASDERRAEQERERRQEEVLVFGGLDFGSRGALFRDDEDDGRDSQWGKTKYGFDDAEWGSTFGDKKSSEPVIR